MDEKIAQFTGELSRPTRCRPRLHVAYGTFDVHCILARNRFRCVEITGANAEQAEFFLQSANGDLDVSCLPD